MQDDIRLLLSSYLAVLSNDFDNWARLLVFEMSLKASSPKRRKQSGTDSNDRSHRDGVHLNKQAYEERERACSYQDYLALITMANFNEHEIRHIPVRMFVLEPPRGQSSSRKRNFPPVQRLRRNFSNAGINYLWKNETSTRTKRSTTMFFIRLPTHGLIPVK